MLRTINYNGNLNEIMKKLNSRKEEINKDVTTAVEEILNDVKINGDDALIFLKVIFIVM